MKTFEIPCLLIVSYITKFSYNLKGPKILFYFKHISSGIILINEQSAKITL